MSDTLPTPGEMVAYLDRYVYGHAQAKKDLAVSVYNHFLALAYRDEHGGKFENFGKQHILLIGPTGTGKSYMLKTLAKMLGVPVGTQTATNLVGTGYVGDKVDSIGERLLSAAGGDARLAERGFIFIDEIDKIRRVPNSSTRDVSGEDVQNGLLTLLDGRKMHLDPKTEIDASRLLFICAGAFVGLTEIIRKRAGRSDAMGFRTAPDAGLEAEEDTQLLRQVETQDLERYGFIPEFIGRFPTVSILDPLSEEDLVRILTRTEETILEKQKLLYRLHGIDLRFTDGALRAIARKAFVTNTGSRALDRVVLRALDAVDYRPLELCAEGVRAITITEDVVVRQAPPELERSPGSPGAAAAPPPAEELRRRAFSPPQEQGGAAGGVRSISDTRDWSDERVRARIEHLRTGALGWEATSPEDRALWRLLEGRFRSEPKRLLRLAEELAMRKVTVAGFLQAAEQADTRSPQAVLHYLDYLQAKRIG